MPYVLCNNVLSCALNKLFSAVFFYIAESNIQRSQQRSSEVTRGNMFLNASMLSVFNEQKKKKGDKSVLKSKISI